MENPTFLDTEGNEKSNAELEQLRADLDKLRQEVFAAETGIFAQVLKWAGLLGLIVSSALASTAIWDWSVRGPADRIASEVEQLERTLTEIARANAEIAAVPAESPQFQAVAQNLNALKIPLTDTALTLVDQIRALDSDAVSGAALLSLSYELANQQRYHEAIRVGTLSAEIAKEKSLELEARRLSATTAFQSLDEDLIEGGRREFQSIADEAAGLEGMARYWVIGNTLRDWIVSEALVGNCVAARDLFIGFETEFDHPGVLWIARGSRDTTTQLINSRQLCQ